MENQAVALKKTGSRYLSRIAVGALLGLVSAVALAAGDGLEFTATTDRTEISMDDSVSLRLSLKADGGANAQAPQFDAPDFEVVNEYTRNFTQGYYENGRFGMRNDQQITKVLKPLKMGTLKISNIQIRANEKTLKAPDLVVQVTAAGAATPPPQGYGGSGIGLRGSAKRSAGRDVFIRAEIDKEKVFKGEQLVVSYFLYRKVRVFNISVDKYPVLNGFLREDLEMPVLGQRLDSERVVLDGTPYERSLLARYAAYPLQEGKLKIDSMALKYNFYSNRGGGSDIDNEDPFMQFFQQMAPRAGSGKSEQVAVEVVPLPVDGKPASFSGGVGDFHVTSAVDRTEVRANQAVTLTVKVEGRGNVAAVGEPRAKWPENVELYDTKGRAKSGKGGVGEKVFEFLLIPRTPGKITLPPVEFSFFDPVKREYSTRSTEPIEITVLEGVPGQEQARSAAPAASGSPGVPKGMSEIRPLKVGPSVQGTGEGQWAARLPIWRWLYWLCILAFAVLAGLVISDLLKNRRREEGLSRAAREKALSKDWRQLKTRALKATQGAPWSDVLQTYELLTGAVFDALDRRYGVGARSLSRSELKRLLVEEQGLAEPVWERTSKLLEYAEMVRFVISAGVIQESAARQELARWVDEGAQLVEKFK